LRVTLLLETVYSVQKILLHAEISQNPTRPGVYTLTNSYYKFCVTKYGILGPEVNILQLMGDFVP